jgi:hypothetical protein
MTPVNTRPSHVRHSTLILSLPSTLICDCIELFLVHPSVLSFRRPLNSEFVSRRSIFSLILWFCKLTMPHVTYKIKVMLSHVTDR